MKKTLSVLLVICLMFTSIFSFPAYAAGDDVNININDLTNKTLAMTDISGKYKTQGRTVLNSDGVLLAHYPATGIEFGAYCKGDVSVTFGTYQPLQWQTNDCYFTVIVDGEVMPRETCHITGTTTGDVTVTIAKELSEGNHTFKVYRQNEIKYAYLGFKSITLNGYLLDAPEDKEMYIEFVGASQWGGAGNLGDANSPSIDTTELQDATQGLTYLTPQLLDADWSVVSLAGTGAYWGIEGYPMNRMYNYYGYMNDKTTLYDFDNARKPDYVVIGLGTNDVSKAEKFGKTEADVYEAFNYFIRLLRMKNPSAKIVWVHGMLNDQATPYVKKAVEDLGGADYGVYELHVEKNNDGASLHPSVEGHTRMAGEIAEFIRSIDSQEFISEFEQKPYAPLSEGEVIMESDFNDADGTNWQKLQGTYVKYMDDDKDGVNDFVRITGNDKVNTASLSAPFKVVPGKDYELSFWARIPEESNEFFTDTYKYYPKFALYKAPVSDGKVTDYYKEGTNDYVYDQDGFTNSVWTFGSELYEFVVKKYTTLNTNNQYQAYACMDTDKIYDGWTRVTYKFTGFSADGSTTATDVAVSFALPKASANSAGCLFDIKDVKMIEIGTNTGSDDNIGSEDTLTTTIMTSDFKADYEKGSTNWVSTLPNSNHVEIKNEADEYFARVSNGGKAHGGMYSTPFEIVPNNEYELSFYFRIPAQTREGGYDFGATNYQPAFGLFEVTTNADKTAVIPKVPGVDNNANNTLYAYSGSELKRRTTFETNWTIELPNNTVNFQKTANSTINYMGPDEYKNIVSEKDATEVYKNWTKFTVKFKGVADESDETSQTAAFVFNFLNVANPEIFFDIKDVKMIEIGTNTGSEDTLTTTILTSDFEKDVTATSWFTSGDVQSKNDSTGDFVRLTVVDMKSAYIRSKAFALTPGKKYTLTYSMRIPEGSENYSTAWTKPFSPEAAFYQIDNGKVGDSVTSKLSDSNLYAHLSFSRRVDMPFIWNVEGYNTHERKGFSDTGYNNASALYLCTGGSDTSVLNNVFSTWKKVTLEFTATAETEGSTDPTIAVLQFRVQNPKDGLIYDVKDVTLTETSLQPETPEEPETPEYKEPVAPEGAVYYESFEDDTDDSVTAFVQNASTVKLSDTDYASGYKSLAISGSGKYLFIPIDTTNFTPGTTYELSMDWKLPANSQISHLMFVGYNGETLDSKFVKTSNVYTYKANSNYSGKTISGTGKWQNLTLRFGNSNYTDHKQYGILLRYTSDTLYLDNLAVAPAKEETVKGVTLTEEERTDDTIKVLAFGNSFSNDSVAWLSHIAKADGKDLRVANCVIGGCSLARHYSNIFNGSSDKYNFTYYTKAHGIKTYSKASMQEALMATDWDYITLQQASGESYKADVYEPYLTELITYIKTFHPNVKILFNETWAYPDESHMFIGQSAFDTDGDGNSEEAPMFEKVREAYLKASQNHGFTPLIPVGEAILRARDEMDRNLSRDGHHLDDRGRLIAALMWYEMFTGVSALDNKVDLTDNNTFVVSYSTTEITGASDINGYNGVEYKGTGLNITAEEQQIMKTIAHETIELYKKANETQLAIEAIGTVDKNSGDAIAKAEALRTELGNDILLPNLQTLIDARAAYDSLVPEVIPGDLDGTGVVGLEDVTALAQALAGWDNDLNEDALDLNGDGEVNLKDLILLARYVAGWDVELK